ncbi:hypothetical protein CN899_08055 [Bacillus thuringiensis]|uniref:Uncharacterized protein n=1 Tax=Bacillus thuringiensis TaxID=1428 RepID=A0A9X7C1D2_BACTU|nr:hypothetical protein [Bacillus thuringiensis]PGH85784.1 hypothetical protein CN899_08055 [Bacillus thuringiensis]
MSYPIREQQARDFYESLNTVKSLTPNQVTVNVANTSVTVLVANSNRKRLFIRNNSTATANPIFIHFAASPATVTNGIPLYPGEAYDLPYNTIYTGEIRAISSTSDNKALYLEEWS